MLINQPITRRKFNKIALTAALAPKVILSANPNTQMPLFKNREWPGYNKTMAIDCLASPGPFNVPGRMDNPLTDEMLKNAKDSGITAVNITVNSGGDDPFAKTVKGIAYWEREVDTHPDTLKKIKKIIGGNWLRVFGEVWA